MTRKLNEEIAVVACERIDRSGSPRTIYFRTAARNLEAQYVEEWYFDIEAYVWKLAQLSLSIWDIESRSDRQEVIALHCEPRETGTSKPSLFKRGPHVHITADGNRLAHAHFPLNYCHLDDVLKSGDALMPAFGKAVEILATEVVQRLARA